MLKVRYFLVQLPGGILGFLDAVKRKADLVPDMPVRVAASTADGAVFSYAMSRQIPIRKIREDGSEEVESVATIDVYSMRLFQTGTRQYLSVIDPPRSARFINSMLDYVFDEGQYFLDAMELMPELIRRHADRFDSARLVSAKIRDFEVYEGAIGRLEITSQSGLRPGIAPFLENKFHRVDALTYEVTQHFAQGLIHYHRNGTLKVSDRLVQFAFPAFEACLD